MDVGMIITGGLGMLATVVSGWVSWVFARKKYYTEVDSNEIENMKKSLDVYNQLLADLEKRVLLESNALVHNQKEIYRLKGVVTEILNVTCSDDKCIKRKFFSEEKINSILKEMNDIHIEEEHEIKA